MDKYNLTHVSSFRKNHVFSEKIDSDTENRLWKLTGDLDSHRANRTSEAIDLTNVNDVPVICREKQFVKPETTGKAWRFDKELLLKSVGITLLFVSPCQICNETRDETFSLRQLRVATIPDFSTSSHWNSNYNHLQRQRNGSESFQVKGIEVFKITE